jgi:hypothetical protein
MARVPFGDWKPSTDEQDEQLTDFGNDALRNEVEGDVNELVNSIEQPQAYEIGGKPYEVKPSVVKGLMDAEAE